VNFNALSFSGLPPISVPFRYFLTAPLFLLIAAVLILLYGEAPWLSRWHPAMLAITHAFTLGFISMVMMGAIYQFLPVIGGIGVSRVKIVATITHTLHVTGCCALMANFVHPNILLQWLAAFSLALSFFIYIGAVGAVLRKKLSQGHTIIGMRLAIVSFAITVLLGLLLNASALFAEYVDFGSLYVTKFANKQLTDLHALIGGLGWAGGLIIAISFQIVPMFHVTPTFPKIISRCLPSTVFVLLICLLFLPTASFSSQLIVAAIFLLNGIFAATLLYLLSKRKRKVVDSSVQFWQFASVSLLILSCAVWLPDSVYSSNVESKKTLLFGAIFIYGYLLSVIQAMLLKILPFLSYTHLQQLCMSDFTAMVHLPQMHTLLKKRHGQRLLAMHVISSVALIIVVLKPSCYWLFGVSMLLEFSWLLFLMLKAVYLYRQALIKIQANLLLN
jgi:hypothetical protein